MESNWNSLDKTWSGSRRSSMYDCDTSAGRIIFNTMKNWPKNVIQVGIKWTSLKLNQILNTSSFADIR